MLRYRTIYKKTGPLRFASHLDLQKIWIRSLLRAKIPLGYSQGFHPSPKIATSWPLPLGWSGMAELIDLWFDYPEDSQLDTSDLIELINRNTPPGLEVSKMDLIFIYAPSLTTSILSADYSMEFLEGTDPNELSDRISQLLTQEKIIRTRRQKEYDLKPLIESVVPLDKSQNPPVVFLRMSARDSAMGRPDEFADALGYDTNDIRFTRQKYYLQPEKQVDVS